MKTEKELDSDILEVTLAISEEFPELSKYIDEMPVKLDGKAGSEKAIENLADYFESLEVMMKQYAVSHASLKL